MRHFNALTTHRFPLSFHLATGPTSVPGARDANGINHVCVYEIVEDRCRRAYAYGKHECGWLVFPNLGETQYPKSLRFSGGVLPARVDAYQGTSKRKGRQKDDGRDETKPVIFGTAERLNNSFSARTRMSLSTDNEEFRYLPKNTFCRINALWYPLHTHVDKLTLQTNNVCFNTHAETTKRANKQARSANHPRNALSKSRTSLTS